MRCGLWGGAEPGPPAAAPGWVWIWALTSFMYVGHRCCVQVIPALMLTGCRPLGPSLESPFCKMGTVTPFP